MSKAAVRALDKTAYVMPAQVVTRGSLTKETAYAARVTVWQVVSYADQATPIGYGKTEDAAWDNAATKLMLSKAAQEELSQGGCAVALN